MCRHSLCTETTSRTRYINKKRANISKHHSVLRLFKAPYSREHKIPPKASFLKEMCCLHLPPEGTRVKNGLKAERVCGRQNSLSAVFMDICGVLMELGLLSRMKPRYLTLLTISSGCLCQRWAPSSLRHWGGGEDTEEEVKPTQHFMFNHLLDLVVVRLRQEKLCGYEVT